MRQTVRYVLKYYSLNCPETVVKTIKWKTLGYINYMFLEKQTATFIKCVT